VVLLKQNVQLMSSIVQNQAPNQSPTSNYAFCVPADTYQLQRAELPTPDPDVTPVASPTSSPVGEPIPVTIPPAPVFNGPAPTPTATATAGTPVPTATPVVKCPTTCTNPDGSCPAVCNNVIVPVP